MEFRNWISGLTPSAAIPASLRPGAVIALCVALFAVIQMPEALAKRNNAGANASEPSMAELERSVAKFEASPNPDPAGFADALDRLGQLYGDSRRFENAELTFLRGLRMLERRYGANAEKDPYYSALLNDLGSSYRAAARFSDAGVVLKRALVIRQRQYGSQHPAVAASMFNLANVMNAASRYAEAEKLYREALVIFEKTLPPTDPIIAKVLTNLANNYLDQGRSSDGLGLQLRVLAIHEKKLGATAPETAGMLANIANSYVVLKRYDEAAPLYEKALRIFAQRFGPDSPQSVITVLSAGRLAQDQGDAGKAERYISRALAIHEKAVGPDHPLIIDILRSLALLDKDRGDFARARSRLDRALSIATLRLGDGHRTTRATLFNIAGVAGAQQHWNEALETLRRANTGANADDRLPDIDRALVEALWHVGQGQPEAAIVDEGFAAAQRAYETRAGAALAQMAVRFGTGDDAIAALVRRQQDLKAVLAALDQRITAELGAVDGKRNDPLIGKLRVEFEQAQASFDDTLGRIVREFPAYAELSSPAPLSVAQAQALLEPDEALVSFVSIKQQSFVFAITRERGLWRKLPLDETAIDERVGKVRASLYSTDPNVAPAPFDLAVMHQFYLDLFGQVEGAIAGKPKLLIVPTGALTSLPFQVLTTQPVDQSVPAQDRARKASWLLNDKAITILPAVTSLRALRTFARTSRATKPFIGFGDPLFQKGDANKRSVSRSLAPYQSYYKGSVVDYDALRRSLPALPDTADELRAVAAALGAGDADLRLGAAASVTGVMSTALQDYRVVDFATHGLVAGEVDGLSEPALVLSLPDRPTEEDDGLLTAGRIAKLRLDADWAVLSACNTAAGDRPGAEGLSGLARAFFYAGARSLLVSHWPVESDAAVKLTTGAFAELRKNPTIGRAEALRRSMRALINDPSSPRNSDPSVWAPFVLVGEGS